MKVAELKGAKLDYWVARALGYRFWAETRGVREAYTLCVTQRPGTREPWMKTQHSEEAKKRYSEVHTFDGLKIGFFGEGVPQYSTDWAQGGPIIEREKITLLPDYGDVYAAMIGAVIESGEITESRAFACGPTPLIATMRAYVASKFGDTVPDEVAA